jgi:hypothetical protein
MINTNNSVRIKKKTKMGRFKEVTSANSGTIVGTRSGTSEKS